MTGISALRREARKASPGSDLSKLLGWAEVHIGDQFDRITELEEQVDRLSEEAGKLRVSIMTIMGVLDHMKKYVDGESFVFDTDQFVKDYVPWADIMAANGMKPDGSPLHTRQRRGK